ncbi:MAG: Dephospho-CoA kinase [Actinomycetota bacterium]|nr:Dephospho-CoA kinase [Actinomycetota bacterium]
MLRIGLTGGIAAGKTTVARHLGRLGARVLDADEIAREVMARDTPGLRAVVEEFGPRILGPDGSLDRTVLGQIVFSDSQARKLLNSLVHPLIEERAQALVARLPERTVMVHEVPLLVENGLQDRYHLVIVVHAPGSERARRLVSERGLSPEQARTRIISQAGDDERKEAADLWLDNGARSAQACEWRGTLGAWWTGRVQPFHRNILTRTPAPRPARLTIHPADPQWADAGRRLARRIAFACGAAALRVDHHGSTAVPGLPAQDVIDLQLVVRDAHVARELRPALEQAGFVRPVDESPRTDAKEILRAPFLSCDPWRAADLHIHSQDCSRWSERLLLRDWLRALPEERARYAALKTDVTGMPVEDYLAAKEPWERHSLKLARDWARRTAWTPQQDT